MDDIRSSLLFLDSIVLRKSSVEGRLYAEGENFMLHKIKSNSLSNICFILGFLSIIASIAVWFMAKGDAGPEALAHAERFGIFIGLWAPTFFILSGRLEE